MHSNKSTINCLIRYFSIYGMGIGMAQNMKRKNKGSLATQLRHKKLYSQLLMVSSLVWVVGTAVNPPTLSSVSLVNGGGNSGLSSCLHHVEAQFVSLPNRLVLWPEDME